MNRTNLLLSALALTLITLFTSCSKKSDSPTPTTTTPTGPSTSPYYFRFTMKGVTDTINGDNSKSYTTNTNAIYGAISSNDISLVPSMSLFISLPAWYDTITESQVLALAGKTLHFSDTDMAPSVSYQTDDSGNESDSRSDVDTSYNVRISTVTLLAADNYQGYPVRNYVITGTCRALMSQYPTQDTTMTGNFKMVITRVVYK